MPRKNPYLLRGIPNGSDRECPAKIRLNRPIEIRQKHSRAVGCLAAQRSQTGQLHPLDFSDIAKQSRPILVQPN